MSAPNNEDMKLSEMTSHIDSLKPAPETAHHDPWNFSSKPAEWHKNFNKRLIRKIDLRLLPMLCLMFLMSYLDRSNLAQARLAGLEKDLNLQGYQFNTATSILFVGYLLMQLPSNLILPKVRPSIYLPAVMLVWGAISGAHAGVKNYTGLVICRFFLGFAEAPYFPGAVLLMSTWYTREELSKRYAVFYAGPATANMFGGLIAAGVLNDLNGVGGLAAWRWLYVIESVITVGLAVISMFILPNFPATTKWLSEEERAYAVWRIANDIGEDEAGTIEPTMLQAIKLAVMDYRTWIFVVMQHAVLLAQTVTFFFPSVVSTLGYNNVITLFLTAPIWAATFVVCLLVAISTSRFERRWLHIVVPMCVTIIGNIMIVTITSRAPRFFAMFLMAMGAQCCFMVVLTWISNTFPRPISKRGVIIAIVNLTGNASNIYGSYLYPSSDAPQYKVAGAVVSGLGGVCISLAIILRFCLIRENKKIEAVGRELEVERSDQGNNVKSNFTGDAERRELYRRDFRYIY